jgi:4-amino-4-deoxy-L-arabinose transferase-like glycosyltransferase
LISVAFAARKNHMRLPTESQRAGHGNAAVTLWVSLITVLALLLRVLALTRKSFMPDEAFSVAIVDMGSRPFWHALVASEANMASYYVLLRGWHQLGDSPSLVRGLSLVFAAATVPVIYSLGTSLFSRRAGVISALLLAANVFHITYSQQARSYSLLVLLVTCSSLFFARCIQKPRSGDHAWYIVTSAAALYTHFFAGLVSLAHFACWMFLPRRLRTWGQLRDMMAVAASGIPLALFIAFQGSSGIAYHLDWAQSSRRASLAKDAYHFLTALSGSGVKFGLFVVACALVLWDWRSRRTGNSGKEQWPLLLVTLWLVVPILITIVVSHWKFLFVARFLIICLPAALLLFAEGLALIRPNWLCFTVVTVTVLASLTAARSYYRQPGSSDWSAAIAYLAENAQPGDMLIFVNPYCRYPFEYNLRFSGKKLPPVLIQYADPASIRDFPAQTNHVWITDFNALAHQHWETLPVRPAGDHALPQFRFKTTLRFPAVEIERFDSVNQERRRVGP